VALRLLIVDDSPEVLALTRELLGRQGITVVGTARDSATALRCAADERPDAALVDIDLAGESGFDLIERLGPAVRVVLTSTHNESDFSDLIDESQAVGFLSKSELSGPAIEAILSGRRGTR
jgi:two-component system, NarL family, nitrate/nitrite response regulator NarL